MRRDCRLCAGRGEITSPSGRPDACGACARVAEAAWRAARRAASTSVDRRAASTFPAQAGGLDLQQPRQVGMGLALSDGQRDPGEGCDRHRNRPAVAFADP